MHSFFGAAATIGSVLEGVADSHKALVIDFGGVPFLDSSAANTISRVARKARKRGVAVFVTGSSQTVRRALLTHGVRPPFARYRETIARAIADIESDRKIASRHTAEKLSVEGDPTRTGPTPE